MIATAFQYDTGSEMRIDPQIAFHFHVCAFSVLTDRKMTAIKSLQFLMQEIKVVQDPVELNFSALALWR